MATRPTVYGYSSERDFLRAARAVRIVEKTELRPKKGRKPPRSLSVGGEVKIAIGRPEARIEAATGDPRVPKTGSVKVIKGSGGWGTDDIVEDCENWVSGELTQDNYVVIEEIGGDPVITIAWC